MERIYTTEEGAKKVKMFIGAEVEKTPAFGNKTLFVVGLQPFEEVRDAAWQNRCPHVYIGANHCYVGKDTEKYGDLIFMLLNTTDLKVTFDFSILDYKVVHDKILNTSSGRDRKFIPMIRMPMPHVESINRNTVVKIDDETFDYSNSGVWCHSINDLLDNNQVTMWNEYGQDSIIK